MYTYTPGPLKGALLGGYYLYADPSVKIEAAGDGPRLWQATGSRVGYLTRFEGRNFNGSRRSVRDLPSDPTIDLRKDNALPLSQVLQDDGFNGMAYWPVLVVALVAALGVGFWRRTRRPRRTAG